MSETKYDEKSFRCGIVPSIEGILSSQAIYDTHAQETAKMLEKSQSAETHLSDMMYTYLWANGYDIRRGYCLRLTDTPCVESPFGRCVHMCGIGRMDTAEEEEICPFCHRKLAGVGYSHPWEKAIPTEHLEFMRMMHARDDTWTISRKPDRWVYKNYGASYRIAAELEGLALAKRTEQDSMTVYKLTEAGLKILETGKWPERTDL